jgi:hypothetical protein
MVLRRSRGCHMALWPFVLIIFDWLFRRGWTLLLLVVVGGQELNNGGGCLLIGTGNGYTSYYWSRPQIQPLNFTEYREAIHLLCTIPHSMRVHTMLLVFISHQP